MEDENQLKSVIMDNVQKMRIIDVFVLAPFMVYAGAVKSNLPNLVRAGLIFFGVTTLVYNGTNFMKNLTKNAANATT